MTSCAQSATVAVQSAGPGSLFQPGYCCCEPMFNHDVWKNLEKQVSFRRKEQADELENIQLQQKGTWQGQFNRGLESCFTCCTKHVDNKKCRMLVALGKRYTWTGYQPSTCMHIATVGNSQNDFHKHEFEGVEKYQHFLCLGCSVGHYQMFQAANHWGHWDAIIQKWAQSNVRPKSRGLSGAIKQQIKLILYKWLQPYIES